MADEPHYHDDYYQAMFTEQGLWSSQFPNRDEIQRASRILPILSHIATQHHQATQTPLRLLDVGSGRGWLSQLLTFYGVVQGVEPVAAVVDHARAAYPHIEFTTGTPQTLRDQQPETRFDVIVSSEVIEHVPHAQQADFMQTLADLLVPSGHAILTTPRAEMRSQWMQHYQATAQPIEDWLTEAQLRQHARTASFEIVQHQRFGAFAGALRQSLIDRALLKCLRIIGYQAAEPARLSIYQLIHLRKRA